MSQLTDSNSLLYQISTPHVHTKQQLHSVHTQKAQLKAIENQIQSRENRLNLLKSQQQKERQRLNKNKEKTKGVIEKKLQIGEILKLKQRDNSQDLQKIQSLKRRNQLMREMHNKELKIILQACYLVKKDEAQQIKNLSLEHQKKIQQIKGEIFTEKKTKQSKIKQLKSLGKQRYREYWKNKLINLYSSQQQISQQIGTIKEQKINYLKQLQQQQIKVLQKLNKIHAENSEIKKDYFTAINIPIKQVVALKNSEKNSKLDEVRTSSLQTEINSQQLKNQSKSQIISDVSKIPKTNLNDVKLRLVINELKKNELKTQRV